MFKLGELPNLEANRTEGTNRVNLIFTILLFVILASTLIQTALGARDWGTRIIMVISLYFGIVSFTQYVALRRYLKERKKK